MFVCIILAEWIKKRVSANRVLYTLSINLGLMLTFPMGSSRTRRVYTLYVLVTNKIIESRRCVCLSVSCVCTILCLILYASRPFLVSCLFTALRCYFAPSDRSDRLCIRSIVFACLLTCCFHTLHKTDGKNG